MPGVAVDLMATGTKSQGGYSQVLDTQRLQCPYCGEMIEIIVDPSVAEQEYVEDCQVCCCPIRFAISVDEYGSVAIGAFHENE